jgi:hypothetical protein
MRPKPTTHDIEHDQEEHLPLCPMQTREIRLAHRSVDREKQEQRSRDRREHCRVEDARNMTEDEPNATSKPSC